MEIEASQIKFGGGKVLLFDLLDYLYKTNQNAKVWIESKIIYKEIQQKYNSYFDLQHTTQLATLFRYMKRRENVLFFLLDSTACQMYEIIGVFSQSPLCQIIFREALLLEKQANPCVFENIFLPFVDILI